MLIWSRFPFVRYAIVAITGILFFDNFPSLWLRSTSILIVILSIFLAVWLTQFFFKTRNFYTVLGLLGLLVIFYSFGYLAQQKDELREPSHWRNIAEKIQAFEGSVISTPRKKTNTVLYTIEVNRILTTSGTRSVSGKLYLYVKKSEKTKTLQYGDYINVLGSPYEISQPTNPEEFNYAKYLARRQIHGQCFVKYDFEVTKNQPQSVILATAFHLRKELQSVIEKNIQNPKAGAITLALLVGIRDYLSEDLKKAYASAGVMHVLAVSGLHVGILYTIIAFFLQPLSNRKFGMPLIFMISIGVIWVYTFVTGMSPSVMRAASMFTVLGIGRAIYKENNIYNSLGISAFVLLIIDPYLIFAIGFQLSFAAVIGIVYLYPKIYKLICSDYWILDKIWSIIAVSIAAQISTLPLTIYYFHQFPTYFFISNLIVIPTAFLIMILGITMFSMNLFSEMIGSFVGTLLECVVRGMNYLITAVEIIPGSLITWLHYDTLQVVCVYSFIILLIIGIHKRLSFYIYASLLVALLFVCRSTTLSWQQTSNDTIIIYDFRNSTAIDFVKNGHASLYLSSKETVDSETLEFKINPYRRANGLNSYDEDVVEMKSLFGNDGRLKFELVGNLKILVLDSSLNEYEIKTPITSDILIVNNHSIKNLTWLTDNFDFKILIIGSKNTWGYSGWIKKELEAQGILCHSLLMDGSWIQSTFD